MSEPNISAVLGQFEAVNRRDFAGALDAYSDDVTLLVPSPFVPAGTFQGREAVGRWFGDWFSAFGRDYRFETEETRAVGERVFAVARHVGSGRASGVTVEQRVAYAFTLADGRISRIELYEDRAEALAAVGLPA